jgi:membrane-associated phospholipid phosphatase
MWDWTCTTRVELKSILKSLPIFVSVVLGSSLAAPAQTPNDSQSPPSVQVDVRDRNLYVDDPATSGSVVKKGVMNVLLDQRDICTSPFHMKREEAKYLLLFGAATGALIATDHKISRQLPESGTSVDVGLNVSRAGQFYSVYPFAGALFLLGASREDEKLRDTGALGVQALVDADIVFSVFKVVARRERPLENGGGGHFEHGGTDFPSGHAAQAWAIASVVAHEYGNHKWVPFAAYGYATLVSASRVAAREHFPSDVLVGGALGYFIGRFVVNTDEEHLGHLHRRHAAWMRPTVAPYSDGGSQTIAVSLNWIP